MIIVSIQHPFQIRIQVVDLSGFCNRDVAAELTGTTSRVLINQQPAAKPTKILKCY